GSHVGSAPAVADQVDGLGDVAGEDDLLRTGGLDEGGHLLAGGLVGRGRLLADGVDAPMGIGVVAAVVVLNALDHGGGVVRGGGTVQVCRRLSIGRAGECG